MGARHLDCKRVARLRGGEWLVVGLSDGEGVSRLKGGERVMARLNREEVTSWYDANRHGSWDSCCDDLVMWLFVGAGWSVGVVEVRGVAV